MKTHIASELPPLSLVAMVSRCHFFHMIIARRIFSTDVYTYASPKMQYMFILAPKVEIAVQPPIVQFFWSQNLQHNNRARTPRQSKKARGLSPTPLVHVSSCFGTDHTFVTIMKMPRGRKAVHLSRSRIQDGARSLILRSMSGSDWDDPPTHLALSYTSSCSVDDPTASPNARARRERTEGNLSAHDLESETAVEAQFVHDAHNTSADATMHFMDPDDSADASVSMEQRLEEGSVSSILQELNESRSSTNVALNGVEVAQGTGNVSSPIRIKHTRSFLSRLSERTRSASRIFAKSLKQVHDEVTGTQEFLRVRSPEYPMDEPKYSLAESPALPPTLRYVTNDSNATWLQTVSQLKYKYPNAPRDASPPEATAFSDSEVISRELKLNETGPLHFEEDELLDVPAEIEETRSVDSYERHRRLRRRRRRHRRHRHGSHRRRRRTSSPEESLPSMSVSTISYASDDDSRDAYDTVMDEEGGWDKVQYQLASAQFDCVVFSLLKCGIDIRDCVGRDGY